MSRHLWSLHGSPFLRFQKIWFCPVYTLLPTPSLAPLLYLLDHMETISQVWPLHIIGTIHTLHFPSKIQTPPTPQNLQHIGRGSNNFDSCFDRFTGWWWWMNPVMSRALYLSQTYLPTLFWSQWVRYVGVKKMLTEEKSLISSCASLLLHYI